MGQDKKKEKIRQHGGVCKRNNLGLEKQQKGLT